MAESSDVVIGQQATALQYNQLRDDTLVFVELAGDEDKAVTGIDAWEDWDISAIVPAGTKSVLVAALHPSFLNIDEPVGARQNGPTLDRSFGPFGITGVVNYRSITSTHGPMLTEVDASRVIEIYAGHTAIRFGIKGYWASIGV